MKYEPKIEIHITVRMVYSLLFFLAPFLLTCFVTLNTNFYIPLELSRIEVIIKQDRFIILSIVFSSNSAEPTVVLNVTTRSSGFLSNCARCFRYISSCWPAQTQKYDLQYIHFTSLASVARVRPMDPAHCRAN
jgi:hypothetical protein